MCRKLIVLILSLYLVSSAGAATVDWDFENGDDHGFDFWSVYPQGLAIDDAEIAGDESLTGVGGPAGLPDAGVAWTVGEPNQFDGQKPAVETGARIDGNGLLNYGLGTEDIPTGSGTLNTYNLNQDGDNLNAKENDQIATSPPVLLGENAVLTVWSYGGGVGTHAPEYDPDSNMMYTDDSSGIAVLSAAGDDKYAILATIHIQSQDTLTEYVLDLSALAGRKVFIEVVDAFEGNEGWLAIDKIQITNAISKNAGFVRDVDDGTIGWDDVQIDHLEKLGYGVTVIYQADIGSTFTIDDANALDLLIISESIGSSSADPLIGTTAPVMNQEGYAWDNWSYMGESVSTGWQTGTEVEIVNDTHPIAVAAGVSVGPMEFYSEPGSFTCDVASNLAPGAELIVQFLNGSDAFAKVFAIDEGAELANGTPSPNRVVGFGLSGYHLVTEETMTDEAWALYDAAIAWLDPDPTPPTAGLIVENPDQLMGFEPQMLERLESLGYVVEIIKGDDVKDDVFTVADAEALDVIVVSEAISSSDVNRLAGANVPIMHGEGYGWHKMNYAEDGTQGWQDATGLADVVNDTHPIVVAAGLSLGTMDFLTHESATTTTAQVSILAPGAVSLVSMVVNGNEYALVFAIDKGAELAKGAGPATNRIVGFSLPGNQEGVLSDAGWALFDAAIDWLDQ